MKKRVTLKDIAQETGYSINTVSRALREKDDIAVQTRKKIQKTAQRMGLIGNNIASSLRTGSTKTIAVILGDVSNPLFAIQMKEIEYAASKNGFSSFLLNTNEDENCEFAAIQSAINNRVEGIIICPTQKTTRNIEYLKTTDIPFVLLGRRFYQLDTDYVICSDELGGYQATKYLIENNHRRILLLNGPHYISSAIERKNGYLKAVKEANLPIDKDLIVEVPLVKDSDFNEILSSITKKDFTALFAFNDVLAWNAWRYLKNSGKKIPHDISIIGFDNIQSRIAIPFSMDSINSNKKKICEFAVEILMRRIQGEKSSSIQLVINTTRVKGESVIPQSRSHSKQ
ncbi:MAG: LacI family transcriptional regulator [Spirochaetia bacterium]|jgi:LacI family transcriptional regulator|nr:LacI family transcriptional regulator [Spirochaetia bacterium]